MRPWGKISLLSGLATVALTVLYLYEAALFWSHMVLHGVLLEVLIHPGRGISEY